MANEVQRLNDIYRAQIAEAQSAGQELASREKKDDAFGAPKKKMVVTNADKKGNTPAYQNYKKGDKRYVAADQCPSGRQHAENGRAAQSGRVVASGVAWDRNRFDRTDHHANAGGERYSCRYGTQPS